MELNNTIAAIATPPGEGGLAIIRLSGPSSYAVAEKVFIPANNNRKLADIPGYTAVYGEFIDEGKPIDDGIALCFRAPHSYTGEDVLELSCHGGETISRLLLSACIKAGARPAHAGEYTRRAVINRRMSLTQAEAVMELIASKSMAGLVAAKAVHSGMLHQQITGIRTSLLELAGHLAAWIDYPEEDVETVEMQAFSTTVNLALQKISMMVENYGKGQLIRRGIRTAIIGSPNVGKSTIFNLLSGNERSIVTPVAGTTRDIIREEINIGNTVLLLADTAGLHNTDDIVENEGINRAKREIEDSELVIMVFDGSAPLQNEQTRLMQQLQNRPSLAIINKMDLGLHINKKTVAPFFKEVVTVSALEADALKIIEKGIQSAIGTSNFNPDAAMLVSERQLAAATEAKEALAQAMEALKQNLSFDAAGVCVEDAIRALYLLTGEDATEAIINEVFTKFCVGK